MSKVTQDIFGFEYFAMLFVQETRALPQPIRFAWSLAFFPRFKQIAGFSMFFNFSLRDIFLPLIWLLWLLWCGYFDAQSKCALGKIDRRAVKKPSVINFVSSDWIWENLRTQGQNMLLCHNMTMGKKNWKAGSRDLPNRSLWLIAINLQQIEDRLFCFLLPLHEV